MTIASDFTDFLASEQAKLDAALADAASAHAALTEALSADVVDKAAAADALAKLSAANAAVQTSASAPMMSGQSDSSSAGLVLFVSEDAYKGDAQFTVMVDGKQVGGTYTATVAHGKDTAAVAIPGTFSVGPHAVAVKFINDLYEGGPDKDRNLYLDGATYNGKLVLDAKRDILNDAPAGFTFTAMDTAAASPAQTTVPEASTPTSAVPTSPATTSTAPVSTVPASTSPAPAPTSASPVTTPVPAPTPSTPTAAPAPVVTAPSAPAPVSADGTPAAATGMKLVFEDDFPGTALDLKKWYPGPKPNGGGFGAAYFVPQSDPHFAEVYTVANGMLRIRATHDDAYVDPENYGRKWRSGQVSSAFPDGTFSGAARQGYFQARMKVPYGLGTWSAFWLLNVSGILHQAGYPGDVEIDIGEMYGQWVKNGGYLVTVHDYGGPLGGQWHSDPVTHTMDLGSDFHDYGCLCTGTEVVIDIDGQEICRTPMPKAATIDKFFALCDLAIDTEWGTPVIPASNSYDLFIERVRIWSADGTAAATPVPVPAPTLSPVSADSATGSSSLPVMTSNTAPAGCLSGTGMGGNSAWMVYDDSTYAKRAGGSVWYSFTTNNGPDRTLPTDATILGIAVTSATFSEGPQTMAVVMGEDAASATTVATLNFAPWTKTLQRQVFHFASPVSAKYMLPMVTVFANGKNAVSLDQIEWLTSL